MGMQLEFVKHFKDLEVYKRQRELSGDVFRLSKRFLTEEKFSLTDQLRRASRSIGAQIAEAWAKRRYEAAFVSKINDALGEATETQSWLDHAVDSGYITPAQFKELDASWQQIGAMLNKMTERAHDFCKSQAR